MSRNAAITRISASAFSSSPRDSVVNVDGRSWDIPNLWVCDGSLFPTVGGGNPSLTIQALACRIGDRIAAMAKGGT
jgi:choline dehydrogenase-like flavoprotein